MKILGIFAVSVAAIAVAAPAFADIASKAYVDDAVATKESTANKLGTMPSGWNDYTYGGTEEEAGQALYPSVYATQEMISNNLNGKVNTQNSSQANGVMVRNSVGIMMKGTGTDVSVDNNGKITVAHAAAADSATSATSATNATNATNDGSGNQITTTYQTKSDSTAVAGNYIQAGTGVGTNLGLLDSAVDAINDKIGTVTSGKTVVEMISDAQSAATYDDTALAGRVTATENAITTLNGSASTSGSVAKSIADAISDMETQTHAGQTYQTKTDSTATAGNYIAAGTGVGTNLGTLDSNLKSVSDVANAAIPKPSGNCTDCVLHYAGATNTFSWEEIGR